MKPLLRLRGLRITKSTILVFVFSLIIQSVLIGKYLDNSIVSSYAPGAVDAADYVSRALNWRTDGFSEAFKDGYRMPGYPVIILLFGFIFPSAPFLGIKLLQVFCLAISVSMIKVVLNKYVSQKVAVLASLIYAVLPMWHFSPVLLAESLSSFIIVFLVFILSSIDISGVTRKKILLLSFLIAVAVYLKPNNLMLIFVVASFLFFLFNKGLLAVIRNMIVLVILFISPWLFFVSNAQPGFIGLTTNSGVNLYIGTGMATVDDGSLLSKSAIRWKVDPQNNPGDVIDISLSESPLIHHKILTSKSIDIWMNRPVREIGYGFEKALFAFGLKSESQLGKTFGLFTLSSIFSGLILLRRSKFQAWGYTLLVVSFLLTLQAILFQADRRFIIPVFFPFAVICIGILVGHLNWLKFSRIKLP